MLIEKIKRLEENLKTLESIKAGYTLDQIEGDKIDEWGLRYGLLESIQIIIDISCGIVAEKNIGTPRNYVECIGLIITGGYLEKAAGEKIKKMIGLRNLLVHEYGIIDIKKLYNYLDNLGDIRNFINEIARQITE